MKVAFLYAKNLLFDKMKIVIVSVQVRFEAITLLTVMDPNHQGAVLFKGLFCSYCQINMVSTLLNDAFIYIGTPF